MADQERECLKEYDRGSWRGTKSRRPATKSSCYLLTTNAKRSVSVRILSDFCYAYFHRESQKFIMAETVNFGIVCLFYRLFCLPKINGFIDVQFFCLSSTITSH